MEELTVEYGKFLDRHRNWMVSHMASLWSKGLHDFANKIHILDYCTQEIAANNHEDISALVGRLGRSVDSIQNILQENREQLKSLQSNFMGGASSYLRDHLRELTEINDLPVDVEFEASNLEDESFLEAIAVAESLLEGLTEREQINSQNSLKMRFDFLLGEFSLEEKGGHDIWNKQEESFPLIPKEFTIKVLSPAFNASIDWRVKILKEGRGEKLEGELKRKT